MSKRTSEFLNLQVLRIAGMTKVSYLVDGREVSRLRIEQMIENGDMLALIKASADECTNGDIYDTVCYLRRKLSSMQSTYTDKAADKNTYFPQYADGMRFYHILWDYTEVLMKEFAPADSATGKYGKPQWQLTVDEINAITDLDEAVKVKHSLDDVCSKSKFRQQFADVLGENYLAIAIERRNAAKAVIKRLEAATRVSPSILAKLEKGKATFTAEELAELKKLLK